MERLGLKLLRVKNKLTQQGVAEKVGISKANYCLIEQGKSNGSDRTWLAIQKLFNLTNEEMWSLKFPSED